jgi:hypothetical protein
MIIYKYPLTIGKIMMFTWGKDSKVVHAGLQDDKLNMWVMHPFEETSSPNEDVKVECRRFVIASTGQEIVDGAEHVSTIIDNPFVWHLLEIP